MTDPRQDLLEVVRMSAQGARIIDLEEYRRRREARGEAGPSTSAPRGALPAMPMAYYPVWVWVPIWLFS